VRAIRIRYFLALAFLLPLTVPAARPVVVVATNMILADLVRQVGGDGVQVSCLARAGVDLHDFEPKASDVRQLAQADLIVINGLGLEPWIGKLVRNSGFRGALIEASRGVDVMVDSDSVDGEAHEIHNHGVDPHAWHDPAAVRIYVRNIREALVGVAPEHAAAFVAREMDFLERLGRIDAWARAALAAVPAADRRIVTSHASLAYLGRAYGIEMIPVSGVSAAAEPNAKRVAEIIDLVRNSGVRALFVDASDNPALLERIAADTGVTLTGRLFTDTLDAPGAGTDNYLAMMEQNLRRILDSLR